MRQPLLKRILVVDLPNSGQAAVAFTKNAQAGGRIVWNDKKNVGETSTAYFPGLVLNSILGGGYSSRLNQEIRIKRGLSYGAGSGFEFFGLLAFRSNRQKIKQAFIDANVGVKRGFLRELLFIDEFLIKP